MDLPADKNENMASCDFFGVLTLVKLCFLWLCEAELTAFSIIDKTASQSSTYSSLYPATKAVDGSTASFSHTAVRDSHPWWQVDLGAEHCVGRITIILRKGCCGEYRFTGATARAGLSSTYSGNQPCGSPATRAQSATGATVQFLCDSPPRMARYVSLDIDLSNPDVTKAVLQLAEVRLEVYMTSECLEKAPDPPELKSTDFKRLQKGASITNAEPLASKQTKSLAQCASHCSKNHACVTFEFASSGGQCRLHRLKPSNIETAPSATISIYVQ